MDELLQEIAERTGVPTDMIERSAAARAQASGVGVEDILRTWAGGGAPAPAPAAAPEPAPPPAPQEAAQVPAEPASPPVPAPQEAVAVEAATPSAPASTGASVASADELIPLAVDKTGVPADLLERAAAARAQASGVAVEEVLSGWAGAEIAPAAAAPPPPPPPPAAPVVEPAPSPVAAPVEPSPEPEPAAPVAGGLRVEVLAPDETQDADEASTSDEGEDVEERAASVLSGFPRWLAASFVLLPIVAMLYVLNTPNAPDCGSAGQLAVDPATGLAVNCDGSPYGAELVDFFSMGEGVYAAKCVACHSVDGSGGVGPPLDAGAVLATFPTCNDHIKWVELGTNGWPDAVYGATNKPVGGAGVMPGFGNDPTLTAQNLAALALYERVAFGLQPLADAETDCGLSHDT